MKNCYFFGSLLLAGTAIMTVYAQSNVTPVPAIAEEEEELFLEDLIVDALPSPSYTGDAVDVAKWPTGMQMFEFVLSRPLVKNVDCEEPVTIYWEDEAMSFIYASAGENDNYAQPPFVQVEYFNPLDLDDENPSQSCTIRIVVSEDPIVFPGSYALEIPEGFFSTTDGEPVEGTMIFYDVINSASGQDVSAEPFSDYVVMSMPEANGIFNRMDSPAGVAMFQYFLNTGDKALSLNPDCKETLKLRAANGEVLSEISSGFDIASYMGDEFVPFAMVNPYGMGELGEEPQTVMIQFFADAYTESGKYYVEIPAGFFKAGDYEVGETMYSYTLVSGDVVASFSSMVYEAYPEYDVQLDVKDDRWAYYGIDCFNYSVEGYDNFAVNKECESPIMILQNGSPFCEIKADETNWTQPYAEVYSLKGFNDEPDPDFGGNASGEDNFGVVADGQDPDFGGNASGEDNFGVDADGQDPDFGGNASGEDNFGVDADGQDPDFGGNASGEDNFGVDADGQDPDFGGNASGEDNFGVDADGQDPDFGGNASGEDNFGVDAVPVLNPWCVNLVLAGKEIKEVGTYTVIIPDGFFKAGGYTVEGSKFTYLVVDVSSIVDTFKAENKVTVYNLNGVRILDNADVEALRGLEKGMYVINGKKVVLK